jgi:hypothetical protein
VFLNLSALLISHKQYFSLTTNQPTVFFSLAFQRSEQGFIVFLSQQISFSGLSTTETISRTLKGNLVTPCSSIQITVRVGTNVPNFKT